MVAKKQINFPRYEHYKDSGIEWIGEIPAHWIGVPGFSFLRLNDIRNDRLIEKNVLSLSYGEIIHRPPEKLTGLVPESFETYQIINPGDIIIRGTDLQNDKLSLRVGYSNYRGIITSAYLGLKVRNSISSKYIYYFLHTLDTTKAIYGLGTGLRQNLSFDDFKKMRFILPPLPEQTAIAQFLDHKTAQIDRAIAIKEAQIKLLNERKQIMIQEAVTKGLDPSVPMKDSGIEWIGEIPAHWEVSKAKFYSSVFVPERSKPELNTNRNGVPWITTDQLRKNTLLIQDAKYFVSEKEANRVGSRKVKKNSVLATCVGTFGLASINNFECIINQQIQAYTNLKINELFFQKIIELSKDYFEINATMTTIAYVNSQAFENMPIVIPPLKEQLKIVHFINKQENHITTGIDNYQSQIQTLKEYKTTLINEAVTGKIKVY